MGTIAEFELPVTEFALGGSFERVPDLEIEIERLVAHDHGQLMPLMWVTAEDFDAVDEAFEFDTSIESAERLSIVGDDQLYRMAWVESTEMVAGVLVEEEGTVLSAPGNESGWEFRVLFSDRKALSRTYDFAEEQELSVTVSRIYDLDETRSGRFGLTEEQHETLVNAVEEGYFDVPRSITQPELAKKLGISHQALSERLRRAQKTLTRNTIIIGDTGEK
jgi:predicted DNA binding protein